jgi:phospholipid/cholesterol/gamma-HCH transport system substrate-binding protein
VALEASIPELRDTLRTAQPALASLNSSLPSVRAFANDALPGVRSSDEALAVSLPFITQARRLMSPSELRGLAAELRRRIPSLVALNSESVPVLEQSRQLSACTNNVLVPFVNSKFSNVQGSDGKNGNGDEQVRYQLQRGLVGLSGESRLSDGNNQWFHTSLSPPALNVQPAPPPVVDQPPPRRPDVPCETQELPNLEAPFAPITAFGGSGSGEDPTVPPLPIPGKKFDESALRRAENLFKEHEADRARMWAKAAKRNEGGR